MFRVAPSSSKALTFRSDPCSSIDFTDKCKGVLSSLFVEFGSAPNASKNEVLVSDPVKTDQWRAVFPLVSLSSISTFRIFTK